MAELLCFSSFPKKILLESIISASTKQIKEFDRESLLEKVTLLKDNIDQAYALILDERKVLLSNDVTLQDQVDMLTRLCYVTEDMVVKFEFKMSLKSLAWPLREKRVELYNLERQLLSMATRLGNAISRLQRHLPMNPLQTPSSLGNNKRLLSHQRKQEPLAGRDEDIKAIIKELTCGDEIKSSGVSIVGMNGVGKSALVHAILNHDQVIQSYDLILGTSLSGPFNSEEISKQLLECYKEAECGSHCNYTSMYQRLHKCRWLIALDNLSDVTDTEWSDFQSLYHSFKKGIFLISTVNNNIPVVTRTSRYCLHPLSDKYCRDVILSKAKTGISDRSLSPEVDILAKKCSGLPIVANFMGFHLHDEHTRRTMLDRDLWEVSEFQREILPTLTSTYSMLNPHHLRKCFAYFSLFPHDYLFNREDLIHLWIGEGFIQCRKESSLDRVGEDYFKTLVKWSILHPSQDCDGEPGYYKIHEFTHRFAKLVASDTCFCLDEGSYSRTLSINTRHLSCKNLKQDCLKNIEKLKGLRTLLPLGHSPFLPSPSLFKRLLYIRVLSFKHTNAVEIPDSISKLKFLRYLDISHTQISRLPDSVCTLHNLQILKIRKTKLLLQLPKNFNKLIKLQYIDWDINDMKHLIPLPPSIGSLTSLQRLPLFEVSAEEGYSINELRYMVSLQGSICITNLENIKDLKDLKPELSNKKSLEEIEFKWTSPNSNREISDVLSALSPHEFLRKLHITNYGGLEFPQWLGNLHLLDTVALRGCIYCKSLPVLGHLPALKILCIEDMRHVESLEHLFCKSSSSFPALESLKLKELPELKEWPGLTATDLPRLHDLEIVDCPTLTSLPSLAHLTSLIDMQIIDCEALHLLPELPLSLASLSISGCNLLKEQCRPLTAQFSMAHRIPKVQIDGKLMPTLGDPNTQEFTVEHDIFTPTEKNQNSADQRYHVIKEALGRFKTTLPRKRQRKTFTKGYGKCFPMKGKENSASDLMPENCSQYKPTSDDQSIQVYYIDRPLESEEEPTSDKGGQLLADPLLHDFPSHMKMMLHCMLFPKDYKFAKKRLIQLWRAAGFLENKAMEVDGDRFFHLLLEKRFIIAPTNEDLSGTIIYQFNVTEFRSFLDKLREVKHFEENIENAILNVNTFADYCDVSVTSGEIDQESFELFRIFTNLRSLLFLNGSVATVPSNIFSAFKFLRTLDLSHTGLKELPTSVRYAKELRYLDLSWTLIEKLPDSIADLFELQYLKLEGCTRLFSLPERMKQLSKLRHLDFDVLGQLTSMPEGIGALVELQTLWAFIVGSTDGYSIKELKNMDNLCGKLCLSGLENVLKVEDAREAALNKKPHLSQLELRWSSIFKKIKKYNYVEVLQGLEPDRCLNDLQIKCFPGLNFPKWVGDRSYSNLVSIMLYKCEHCKLLPSLGELPTLENLEIIDMNGVTKIDDRNAFPKLKTLTIDGMKSLKKWSGLNGVNFPSIINLTIKHCPKLSTLKLSLPPSENGQSSASLPCSNVEIVNCPKLARLPDRLLSSSLQTLIIEDCPLGHRYGEGGKDRGKINPDAKVWIFQGTPTSDEEIPYSVLNSNLNLEETGIPPNEQIVQNPTAKRSS